MGTAISPFMQFVTFLGPVGTTVLGCFGALAVVVIALMFFDGMEHGSMISKPFWAWVNRRAALREAESRHRRRLELLKQLNDLAAMEGVNAAFGEGTHYAHVRETLLSELDTNLQTAAIVDEQPASQPVKARRRTRS